MMSELVWQAETVVRAVHGESLHEQSWKAHGVSIDSRSIKEGDLFVALKGPAHDGHDHVAAAITAGAAVALVSRQPQQVPANGRLVFVEDTFKALEDLGRAGRKRAEGRIIAVTGSVGKTGTKEMLRLMLNACGDTYANEGSLNNHWGVPLSLSRLPERARYGVFELGMNHAGELTVLSKQVRPHVALITTIEAVHLEFFASLEAIADAKAEIFLGMSPDGAAVLNRDNAQYARLAAAAKAHGIKKILGFGRANKADAQIVNCAAMAAGSTVEADILGKRVKYMLPVPGDHIVLNSLGALLAVAATGADVEVAAAALSHYQPPKGRGLSESIMVPGGTIELIDESYNASPAAVRAAIAVLGRMNPTVVGGRRILALGDMRELGELAPELHAELAQDIIDAKISTVFSCGEMMEHLHKALPASLRGAHAKDSEALAPIVADALHVGDIVTVKGSHSMAMERVVAAIRARGTPKQKLAG
jgi:UDP-N-acetylmuramoyl-tripeptide--D-alanyl-D-alanine ligase